MDTVIITIKKVVEKNFPPGFLDKTGRFYAKRDDFVLHKYEGWQQFSSAIAGSNTLFYDLIDIISCLEKLQCV